jgi:hypothetical protein
VIQRYVVPQIGLYQSPVRVLSMRCNVLFLDRSRVERIEVVKDSDGMTALQERIDQMASDKPRSARHE